VALAAGVKGLSSVGAAAAQKVQNAVFSRIKV